MPYDIGLADQVRSLLAEHTEAEEIAMFSGLCFMVNKKMCICISHDNLLCRIGAAGVDKALETGHCRQMVNNGRISRDYVFVSPGGFKTTEQLKNWINLCLAFNLIAKASKKSNQK